MKKGFIFIAMIALLAFASCNAPKTEAVSAPAADTTQALDSVITVGVDSTAVVK
jgi:hypothetical protein